MPDILTSLHGRKLGLGAAGQLIAHDIEITRPCVDATVTVADESPANNRTITVQLLDALGQPINYVETFEILIFLNAERTAFVVTGGSTGLVAGTDGALLALVAKKVFLATSEADGDWDGVYTDTTTEAAFIGVRLPNGRVVMGSQALTMAA